MSSLHSSLRATLVQCDLRWENPVENCDRIDAMLGDTGSDVTDLIVLPEMFATGFTMNSREMAQPFDESDVVKWMSAQAIQRGCVITGSVAVKQNEEYYNRMIWATPDGELKFYDKRHLFRMAGEHQRYAMGQDRVVVELNGFRILLSVCYDLRFPVWLRQQSSSEQPFEYDLLVCVANWPAPRAHPWRILLQARAVENLCYVIGVNRVGDDAKGNHYSGDSMLVDFKGEPKCDYPKGEAFIETCQLHKAALNSFRDSFPAWQDADRHQVF
ncbi:amidohydrolase [Nitrincola iocasae]|uniref:Omega-amidase YafV n=1 Tax=Nitrincola iocasae TaxID=2614693 RepID=A0A5J6LDW1_9GAMM|nr:amidohydrolase [Nitrincola iocasae]QEW06770.1 amidohydrolase [Nitrincola iocasae]